MAIGDNIGKDGELHVVVTPSQPPAKVAQIMGKTSGGVPIEMHATATGLADSFTPSSYDADLTMDGTAQSVALVSGARRLTIVNRGVTTEAIRVVFGTSASNAEANLTIAGSLATTGFYWPAIADLPEMLRIGVPDGMTHYAIANAVSGDTQLVSVNQAV